MKNYFYFPRCCKKKLVKKNCIIEIKCFANIYARCKVLIEFLHRCWTWLALCIFSPLHSSETSLTNSQWKMGEKWNFILVSNYIFPCKSWVQYVDVLLYICSNEKNYYSKVISIVVSSLSSTSKQVIWAF